ncbi:MAG: thiol-disulfide oxidoreductase DCC family protein [Cyclobacteriaceae bacterium]|nr:thiol-disulfide oxidoreductase DCC family protein [Cyclobacteriaceae bacterium]MCH8516938.1 thiol-disulfide oxidoreductase DCC family protein [Cyclobacteriaceae bacterium]
MKKAEVFEPRSKPILLFDGICNLCNGAVDFIIKRDPKNHFLLASLQSRKGQALLDHFQLEKKEFSSLVLIEGEKVYLKSTAALRAAKKLNGLWPATYIFIIVPSFIRDVVYDIIARNRYHWFGKSKSCRLPTAEEKTRFLD